MALTPFRFDESATYWGLESTFATLPTVYRAYPINGTVDIATDATQLEVEDESVYLYDLKDPVHGIKRATAKFGYYLRPNDALGTAALSATTPLGLALKSVFGGESSSAVGTTVNDAAATTTVVIVTTAANMIIGQWWLWQVAGALEPSRIVDISTNTITLSPPLSGAPTNGGIVVAMHNYHHLSANTNTLYLQHIKANSGTYHKWSLKGGVMDCQFKTDRNALLRADFSGTFGDYDFPSAESPATTVGADTGAPWALKDATVILQANAATPATPLAARTQFQIKSFTHKLNNGMAHLESLSSTGAFGAMRTGQRSVGDITLKLYADSTALTEFTTWWTARTALEFDLMVPQGTLLTKRWAVFSAAKAHIKDAPKYSTDGGVGTVDITLRPTIRNTAGTTETARAPYVVALG